MIDSSKLTKEELDILLILTLKLDRSRHENIKNYSEIVAATSLMASLVRKIRKDVK